MSVETIAAYAWETYTPRTLVSGTPDAPTTPAERIAGVIWTATGRTLTGAPAAITDLSATAVSIPQIDLTWTAPSGATSQRVERALGGG